MFEFIKIKQFAHTTNKIKREVIDWGKFLQNIYIYIYDKILYPEYIRNFQKSRIIQSFFLNGPIFKWKLHQRRHINGKFTYKVSHVIIIAV